MEVYTVMWKDAEEEWVSYLGTFTDYGIASDCITDNMSIRFELADLEEDEYDYYLENEYQIITSKLDIHNTVGI